MKLIFQALIFWSCIWVVRKAVRVRDWWTGAWTRPPMWRTNHSLIVASGQFVPFGIAEDQDDFIESHSC